MDNELQYLVNQIAKMIDAGQRCICTNKHHGRYDAGHLFSRGGHPELKYNLHNIHKQSFHSNQVLCGDFEKYKEGIKRVYGEQYLQKVLEIKGFDFDIATAIKAGRRIYDKIKKADRVYTPAERVLLRELVNKELFGRNY